MPLRRTLPPAVLSALLALAAADAARAVNRQAFVTSVTGTGNLTSWPDAGPSVGLAAGDAICRSRATIAGLPNPNTYRAWLSSSTVDAYCRVQALSGTRAPGCVGGPPLPAGPWYLSDGTSAFSPGLDALTGPERVIYRPLFRDEFGTLISSASAATVWTGTDPTGVELSNRTCLDWTSPSATELGGYGSAVGSSQLWTFQTYGDCSVPRRLMCFEPGASDAPIVGWSLPGAITFVTSATGPGELGAWDEAGAQVGLAAGDAICRNLAAAARLPAPSSFVAWLSDAATDAIDRLANDGPFRRPDGFAIAFSRADLTDGVTTNSLHVTEQSTYLADGGFVWTGTGADGVGLGVDCSDWTDGTSGASGRYGLGSMARNANWTSSSTTPCQLERRLYCFANVITIFWDGFDLTEDASRWSTVVP